MNFQIREEIFSILKDLIRLVYQFLIQTFVE